MTGISTLKIAASISLGIHILILAIFSGSFRDSNIHRTATLRNVKVTLLPLVTKEKPDVKIILPMPLKVGNQDRQEPVLDVEGISKDPLPSSKSAAKNILPKEPGPFSEKREEERILKEPMNVSMDEGRPSDTNPNLNKEGNTVSSKEATSTGGNLSISLPSLHSGESSGGAFSFRSSRDGQGSGTGPGNGGSGNGGSGKGEGIFSKIFSSRGGGNGARPRYAENPKPIYPQEAKEKGHEGEVVLRVEVLSNGRVGQIEIRKSSGFELLDHSALTTVKQWRFIPAKKGDVAIPLWVNIPVKFQLQ